MRVRYRLWAFIAWDKISILHYEGDQMRATSRVTRFLSQSVRSPDALTPRALRNIFRRRGISPNIFLEVGANDGTDTRRLQRVFPSVNFYCFEPDPRAIREFRSNISHPNIVLHEAALGAQNGVSPFYQSSGAPPGRQDDFPKGWHYSGSTRRPTGHLEVHPWCSFDEVIEVPVWTLDSWFVKKKMPLIDFIWADVQGAEIDLVLGGRLALSRTRFFYTEFSELELYEGQVGLQGLLEALPGWNIHTMFSNDVLLENLGLNIELSSDTALTRLTTEST